MTELIQSVDPSPIEIAEFGEITEMTEIIQSCDPYFFLVFICIIGGTPDKGISEGLF